MEKEENFSKSQVFYILKNEPDRIELEPNPLYEGGLTLNLFLNS